MQVFINIRLCRTAVKGFTPAAQPQRIIKMILPENNKLRRPEIPLPKHSPNGTGAHNI